MSEMTQTIWKLQNEAADLLDHPALIKTESQHTAACLVVNELTAAATVRGFEASASHLVNAARLAQLAGLNVYGLQEYAGGIERDLDRFTAERPDYYPGVA